jgi:integrase
MRWGDVRKSTLLVQRALDGDGVVKATKTRQARTVRLLEPLTLDLAEWRMACGRPGDDALVFGSPRGDFATETDTKNWREREWARACHAAGVVPVPRPYDLRHSCVSLLLAEGSDRAVRPASSATTPASPSRATATSSTSSRTTPGVDVIAETRAAREGSRSIFVPSATFGGLS